MRRGSVTWSCSAPHRPLVDPLDALQGEQRGGARSVPDAVKHGRHASASVDARADHHAHLVNQSCRKERAVDVPAPGDGEARHAKVGAEPVHGTRQVDAPAAGGYPRDALRGQAVEAFPRAILARDDEQRAVVIFRLPPSQPAVRVECHRVAFGADSHVDCLVPHRGLVAGHKRLGLGIVHLHRHPAHQLRGAAEPLQRLVVGIRRVDLLRHVAVDAPVHRHHHVGNDIRSHIFIKFFYAAKLSRARPPAVYILRIVGICPNAVRGAVSWRVCSDVRGRGVRCRAVSLVCPM